MIKRMGCLLLILTGFTACQQRSQQEKEIAKIPISFKVERFDKKFNAATPESLPVLKEEYPFLFPKKYPDSVWVHKLTDTLHVALSDSVAKRYPTFKPEKEALHGLFQHLKYYDSHFYVPRVITLVTEVDYRHRVIVTDSLLLIGLDNYLGENSKFYEGIQRYLVAHFKPSQILPDVARAYARRKVPRPDGRDFLAYMIHYGKIRYFEERLLPQESEAAIMGYSQEQQQWAQNNERQIWGYFIEKDLLYKAGPKLRRRFFDIGPFTKFGLQLDRHSPPRLGQWMGLQIVKQFAEKHKKVALSTLLQMDSQELFKKSNYKPKQD